jgi:hypothetical protein
LRSAPDFGIVQFVQAGDAGDLTDPLHVLGVHIGFRAYAHAGAGADVLDA